MGFEAHPNEYEKRHDTDGVFYVRKPEYRAEQEVKLQQATEEERENQERAEEHKRATRRTAPLDSVEYADALRRAEEVARFIVQSAKAGTDVN